MALIDKIGILAESFYGLTVFSKSPSAGVLFFCPEEEKVFLTHRSPQMSSAGTWDIPGGRPEKFDNSALETMYREVYEEIGTVPKNKTPIKTHTIKTKEHHYIVYLIPLSSKEKKALTKKIKLSDESDDYRWFEYNQIPTNTHFDLTWVASELNA